MSSIHIKWEHAHTRINVVCHLDRAAFLALTGLSACLVSSNLDDQNNRSGNTPGRSLGIQTLIMAIQEMPPGEQASDSVSVSSRPESIHGPAHAGQVHMAETASVVDHLKV